MFITILQVLVDCSGPQNEPKNENTGLKHKNEALISALELRRIPRTLIFCNTIKRIIYNTHGGLKTTILCVHNPIIVHHIFNPLNVSRLPRSGEYLESLLSRKEAQACYSRIS